MGNGAKAQQKRERNAKDAKGAAKSQLKDNAAAMNKVGADIDHFGLGMTDGISEVRQVLSGLPVDDQQEGEMLRNA